MGVSRDAELGLAELLGSASLFSPETALESQQTDSATKSPSCQTAQNDVRVESRRHYVSQLLPAETERHPFATAAEPRGRCEGWGRGSGGERGGDGQRASREQPDGQTANASFARLLYSYNRYLAVAARVVRRSLKEEHRLVAERRGQQELRFAKWTVSRNPHQQKRLARPEPDRTNGEQWGLTEDGFARNSGRQAGRGQEPG